MEGAPGPWLVPASAVRAYQEGRRAVDAANTIALPREEVPPPGGDQPGGGIVDKPSETSERLSEGVGALRDKVEEILVELDRLEGRLEVAEVEQLALRETASRERERADKLQADLDAARAGRQREPGGSWRRFFGR